MSRSRKEFFDSHAAEWDAKMPPDKRAQLESIVKNEFPVIKGTVLDLGSGTGVMAPLLRVKSNSQFRIIECDISLNMLKTAKLKHAEHSDEHYIQLDAHHLPIKNDAIDFAVCFAVYPHFDDMNAATGEIYRTLGNDGTLIILHLMNHEELNGMHHKEKEAVKDDYMPPADELSEMLNESGFDVKIIDEQPGKYFIVARKV